MATYEAATNGNSSSLDLYAWNAKVSGSLLIPLHICEVAIRNAVAETLENVYGARWPWSTTFERSLPNPSCGYNQRRDLLSARGANQSAGKVIPELKLVFWQKMFTSRHDTRLWDQYFGNIFPNMNPAQSVSTRRQTIYDEIGQIRILRNRIAHHEPIFHRNLLDDYHKILSIVRHRSQVTSDWLEQHQDATGLIAAKP